VDFRENLKVVSVPATAVIPTVYGSSYVAGKPVAVDVRDVTVVFVAALNPAFC
jgi:hypothetical protein